MGLSQLILGESNFEKLLSLAVKGKSENVDLLIKDIFLSQDSPMTENSDFDQQGPNDEPIAVRLYLVVAESLTVA